MDKCEEALAKARAGKSLEEIFPEMKESEDERIRKEAISIVQSYMNICDEEGDPCLSGYKVLAYLEKQKDLFKSGIGLYYYDGEKTTYCGYPATEENPYDFAISQQEKQKESLHIEKTCKENADSFMDENERIRKDIIALIKFGLTEGSAVSPGSYTTKEEALAYLEKLGEQKYLYYDQGFAEGMRQSKLIANSEIIVNPPKITNKVSVSEELYEHIRETCACIDDAMSSKTLADMTDYLEMADKSIQAAFDMLEKQKEQKPEIKYVYPIFNVGDTIKPKAYNESHRINKIKDDNYVLDNGFTFPIVDQDVWEIVEQTTEWNEEDKKFWKAILQDLANIKAVHPKVNIQDEFNWFKNLPERLKSLRPQSKAKQKPADWSEEDEEDNIYLLLCMVDAVDSIPYINGTLRVSDEKKKELKEFIKRSSWKPSEEQMCYLKKVYESYDFCDGERDALESLHNCLKKLGVKEEPEYYQHFVPDC